MVSQTPSLRRTPRPHIAITKASHKLFKRPTKPTLRAINKKYAKAFAHAARRSEMHRRNQHRKKHGFPIIPIEGYPVCLTTAGPEETNIGTKTTLNHWECLRFLDMDKGTPTQLVDVYMESLCVHANQRLSEITQVDRSSPDADPLFYSIPCGPIGLSKLDKQKREDRQLLITRRQFWKLRYLFMPMLFRVGSTGSKQQVHLVLGVVSPEAKTIDYICSDEDTRDPHGKLKSLCVGQALQELAEFSDNHHHSSQRIIPEEWRMRTTVGDRQALGSADCGIYSMTHALYIAFGYGITQGKGTFIPDHQDRMLDRRYRIIEELISHELYAADNTKSSKLNDYPVFDLPPTNLVSDGWKPLDKYALSQLSLEVRNRRRHSNA